MTVPSDNLVNRKPDVTISVKETIFYIHFWNNSNTLFSSS